MASPADICSIVRLRKTVSLWRKFAGRGRAGERKPPRDVPPGHLAVTVGEAGRRFVIKASYLNHPIFRQLLDQAYEEYGHGNDGPLAIPCDEFLFEDIIQSLRDCRNLSPCSCHAAEKKSGRARGENPDLFSIDNMVDQLFLHERMIRRNCCCY